MNKISNLTNLHKSVLLQETIDSLNIKNGDFVVDCTLGGGGHAESIIKKFAKSVNILAIDADAASIEMVKNRLSKYDANIFYEIGNFRDIDLILEKYKDLSPKNNQLKIQKIIFDLGFSTNQIETSGRGFSLRVSEPLFMTFNKNPQEGDLTAEKIVNNWGEENICLILKVYGEERWASRIAKKIVEARKLNPIKTTNDLVQIILSSIPSKWHHGRLHPATKTFQALRITVNNELESLKQAIEKSFKLLDSGGRIAVITFHSLEDRIVKNYFKTFEQTGFGKRVNKKPIVASNVEREENTKSRSAKLRVIEKK